MYTDINIIKTNQRSTMLQINLVETELLSGEKIGWMYV